MVACTGLEIEDVSVEQGNVWIITLIALAIGAFIGFLIGRVRGSSSREQELQDQLHDVHSELEQYRTKVARHFEETAELIRGLNDQYRRVYQHLAHGAESLSPEVSPSIVSQPGMTPELELGAISNDRSAKSGKEEQSPQPPRDYAPKRSGEPGALSEHSGLGRAKVDKPTGRSVEDEPTPQAEADAEGSDSRPSEQETKG